MKALITAGLRETTVPATLITGRERETKGDTVVLSPTVAACPSYATGLEGNGVVGVVSGGEEDGEEEDRFAEYRSYEPPTKTGLKKIRKMAMIPVLKARHKANKKHLKITGFLPPAPVTTFSSICHEDKANRLPYEQLRTTRRFRRRKQQETTAKVNFALEHGLDVKHFLSGMQFTEFGVQFTEATRRQQHHARMNMIWTRSRDAYQTMLRATRYGVEDLSDVVTPLEADETLFDLHARLAEDESWLAFIETVREDEAKTQRAKIEADRIKQMEINAAWDEHATFKTSQTATAPIAALVI